MCILSNCHEDACKVSYIIPYNKCNIYTHHNINNGLFLEAGLHLLFDKYLWSINQDSIVVVSNKILYNNSYHIINQYHNKKLTLHRKQLKYLKHHYNEFLKKQENKTNPAI